MATGCRDYSKPSTLSTAISSATCISPRTTPTTHTPARAEDECHGKKKAPDVGAHGHSSAEDAHGKPSASNNDIKVAVHRLGKGALGVVECSPDLYLRDTGSWWCGLGVPAWQDCLCLRAALQAGLVNHIYFPLPPTQLTLWPLSASSWAASTINLSAPGIRRPLLAMISPVGSQRGNRNGFTTKLVRCIHMHGD